MKLTKADQTLRGIRLGSTYVVAVSDRLARVRIDAFPQTGGIDGTDLATGRKIHITLASISRRVKGEVTK